MKTAQTQTPTLKLGLRFDFNAFAELQDKCGLNILDKKSLDKIELTPVVIRQLVWAGLLYKQPELTLAEAGRKFELTQLAEVVAEVQAALVKSFTGK